MTHAEQHRAKAINTIAKNAALWVIAPDKEHPIGAHKLLFANAEARNSALNILRANFDYEALDSANRPIQGRKGTAIYAIDITANAGAIEALSSAIDETRIIHPKTDKNTGERTNERPSSEAFHRALSTLPDAFSLGA